MSTLYDTMINMGKVVDKTINLYRNPVYSTAQQPRVLMASFQCIELLYALLWVS